MNCSIFPVASLFALGILAGCATQPPAPPATDPIATRLTQSAGRVEQMLAEMNALERSRQANPAQVKAAAELLPPNHPLMKKITAVWQGDVRIVIRKLADQFGMDVLVKGASPTPLMVSVSAKDQPFVSILESIGAQTGNIANITCDSGKNLIVIEYR